MTFLEELHALADRGDVDEAGYRVFDKIDLLLCSGKLAELDALLKAIEVNRLPVVILRGFLCMTRLAKDKLPSRAGLFERVQARLLVMKGEERTARILKHLE